MEKGKRIEAEIQLPEAIIQHIQSFLTGKEAAQTTIVSKSWHSAWLTRPNLDFVQRDFVSFHRDLGDVEEFWKFVKKTVQRYENLNLRIQSLRLWIDGTCPWLADTCPNKAKHCCLSPANELIVKAMEMGAIDLNLNIKCTKMEFALPREVLGSENLITLSVSGCKIGGKVCCSRLKSLCLDRMWLEEDIIWNIFSSCRLIEKFSISGSILLFETQSSTSNAVSIARMGKLMLSPFIDFGKHNLGSAVGVSTNLYEFHKLTYLFLKGVDVHTLFFNDLSSRFPCLKDLVVHDCGGYKGIRISSPSLEHINFSQRRMLRVKFDVPNIRKFTFSGRHVPSLSFKTARTNWESDISISWDHWDALPKVTWFLDLNKLLTKLSLSRVSLSLSVENYMNLDHIQNFQVSFKPAVENLTVHAPFSVCPALFNILFECCRPVSVTQELSGCDVEKLRKNDILKTVVKRVAQQASLICICANRSRCGPCDLELVNEEFFDEAVSVRQSLVLDSSTCVGAKWRFRFRLRWGQEPAALKSNSFDNL